MCHDGGTLRCRIFKISLSLRWRCWNLRRLCQCQVAFILFRAFLIRNPSNRLLNQLRCLFVNRALFFGKNEIDVQVPSLFRLFIKEVRFRDEKITFVSIFFFCSFFCSLTVIYFLFFPQGLEPILHLPALRYCSVGCSGLFPLFPQRVIFFFHFNSCLFVLHKKGEQNRTIRFPSYILLFLPKKNAVFCTFGCLNFCLKNWLHRLKFQHKSMRKKIFFFNPAKCYPMGTKSIMPRT